MTVYYVAGFPYSNELFHHGIKGQKWGIRRFQNEDGTLTSQGKIRYGKNGLSRFGDSSKTSSKVSLSDGKSDDRVKFKKALKIAAIAAAAGLTAYGVYKLGQSGVLENAKEDLAARSKIASDAAKARTMSIEDIVAKSDELNKRIEFMNKSREILTSSGDPARDMAIKAGQKVIASALSGAAAVAGYSLVNGKMMDRQQVANYTFPNPNKKKN